MQELIRELPPATILKMREVSKKDYEGARETLDALETSLYPREVEDAGIFDRYAVESGSRTYTVALLGFFAWCECEFFKYGKGKACKHVLVCLPKVCRNCLEHPVRAVGDECPGCEVTNAIYLKPTRERKTEKVGGIKI